MLKYKWETLDRIYVPHNVKVAKYKGEYIPAVFKRVYLRVLH
jgi:hypothetical protein